MADNSKGFGFYESYWSSIQHLPLEQQKEVCYAIAKYGITGDMVDPNEMPFGFALTQANKLSIDNSVFRWEANAQKATMKEDKKIAREQQVQQLIDEGRTLKEIAVEMGLSESTVKRTESWKNRGSSKTVQSGPLNDLARGQKTGQTGQNELVMNSSNDRSNELYDRSNEPKNSSNELFQF